MEDVQITVAMCVFKKHCQPAENLQEANEYLSTQDILNKFHELLGNDYLDHETMYDLLTSHGFIYDYVMDGFRWLIKMDEF